MTVGSLRFLFTPVERIFPWRTITAACLLVISEVRLSLIAISRKCASLFDKGLELAPFQNQFSLPYVLRIGVMFSRCCWMHFWHNRQSAGSALGSSMVLIVAHIRRLQATSGLSLIGTPVSGFMGPVMFAFYQW